MKVEFLFRLVMFPRGFCGLIFSGRTLVREVLPQFTLRKKLTYGQVIAAKSILLLKSLSISY
jgi:hypothetical protein